MTAEGQRLIADRHADVVKVIDDLRAEMVKVGALRRSLGALMSDQSTTLNVGANIIKVIADDGSVQPAWNACHAYARTADAVLAGLRDVIADMAKMRDAAKVVSSEVAEASTRYREREHRAAGAAR